MGIHNLDKVFNPSSIAVVGASNREGSIGKAILRNLIDTGFSGSIFPVNPRRKIIQGHPCYWSLSAIGQKIDLVVIATPIQVVPDVIRECGLCGVCAAVVISSGGKEIGGEGSRIEAAIRRKAEEGGVRIIGPNCLGVISSRNRVNASFASRMPLPGKMAFISQSGAICTTILDWACSENIGFSHFVSVGSMLDIDFGDLIDYLGHETDVSSILLYIESLEDVRKFLSAARAVSRVKPIVALKSGRSIAGAKAAGSHTGAMSGEDAFYDEAFKRAGVVRVDTIEELFDCAELMAKQPRPRGGRLAILTNAGGPGVMAADALSACGLEPAPLSSETMAKLNEFLPSHWSHNNPIDILGDATPERFTNAAKICIEAPEFDGLLLITCPQAVTSPTDFAAALSHELGSRRFPIFAAWMGGADAEDGRRILSEADIPCYDTPERAVKAFHSMYTYDRNLKLSYEAPRKVRPSFQFDTDQAKRVIKDVLYQGRCLLTEMESKRLLKAYGLPINPTMKAESEEEAVYCAEEMGYPVAVKLLSPDITHKSDAGGVMLGMNNPSDVRSAYSRIMENARTYDPVAKLTGVTVQPMVRRPEVELILGCKKDERFGPVLLFGLGGVMTEVLQDRALGLAPLNALLARRMIESTKVYRLLRGFRGQPPADIQGLEELLMRLSHLAADFPQIAELDINPLAVADGRYLALDARVMVETSEVPAPLHLAISPYPNQFESTVVTKSGLKIFVRPIRPEDAPLLVDMYHTLSDRSIYLRFCHAMKELPPDMLARFTQIDYDREMALVAFQVDASEEKILGVARAINLPDGESAELAIVVSDPWQGRGIGACLMELLMEIMINRGIRRLYAYILPENLVTRALVSKLGWTSEGPGSYDFHYEAPEYAYEESPPVLVRAEQSERNASFIRS